MKPVPLILFTTASLALARIPAAAQDQTPIEGQGPATLVESGQIIIDGHPASYVIRHLPISSFPALPPTIQMELSVRGCLIPQTYEAHHPENVVHASLEQPGSSDWAVLCSAQGTVSLLVFFGSSSGKPLTLASAPETERLQLHDPSGVLGFNWGIDIASPGDVHDAQLEMLHPPPRLDHDALADTLVDRHTIYRFYLKSAWIVIEIRD